jgi:hypothetical protein
MYLGTRIRLRWSRLVLLSGNDETMLIVELTATQLLQDLYARPISSAANLYISQSGSLRVKEAVTSVFVERSCHSLC